jgi:hypothetical protein
MDRSHNSLNLRGLSRNIIRRGDYMPMVGAADLDPISLNNRGRADLNVLESTNDLDFVFFRAFRECHRLSPYGVGLTTLRSGRGDHEAL